MRISFPNKLVNNYRGYVFFTDLFVRTKNMEGEEIILDLKDTCQFDVNLCAVFGAVMHELEQRKNKLKLINIQPSVQNQISRFGVSRGRTRTSPAWKSFIKCSHFNRADEEALQKYIDNRIFSSRFLDATDAQLQMAINLCVGEIFRNAFLHGQGRDVFLAHHVSGFKKRLYVTLVSWGKTLKEVVGLHLQKDVTGVEAIQWAVKSGSSILEDSDRGHGLSTIRQFIDQNQGKIQIISADGVWKQVKHRMFYKPYHEEFPGTIITLEFNIG